MGGFVKLYSSMLNSSVWDEDPVTSKVWVTLLLMADADGHVDAQLPGVAHQARVSREDCLRAVTVLMAPDPHSVSANDDGVRLHDIEAEGRQGYQIVNHAKYRKKQTKRQVQVAKAVATHRAKNVIKGNQVIAEAEAEAELTTRGVGGSGEPLSSSPPIPSDKAAISEIFAHWQRVLGHPKAQLTPDRTRKIRGRLRDGYAPDDIKAAIDGIATSPFHRGENDQGTVHDSINLICRNGDNIEKYMAMSAGQAKGEKPRPLTPAEIAALEDT